MVFFLVVYTKVSPTSCGVDDNSFYDDVTKADTRVLGPFTDKDEVIHIPRQIRKVWAAKVSPTSCGVDDNSFYDYVTKADTRVLGPFTDKDEVIHIPRLRKISALRPW